MDPMEQFGAGADQVRSARLFDLVHRGTPGDVSFYRDRCAGAGTVLELGCGTGRMLWPIAAAGAEVHGVDVEVGALAAAAADCPQRLAPRVSLQVGDMTALRLDARFDRVIVPYNGLFALHNDAAFEAALDTAVRHLAPNGRLIFDVYAIDDDVEDDDELVVEDGEFEYVITVLEAGRRVDVYDRERPLSEVRSLAIDYRYLIDPSEDAPGEVVDLTVRHHFLTPQAVLRAVRRTGLRVDETLGDFDGSAFDPDTSDRLIVVAAR